MSDWKLVLEYDGSDFAGFQTQHTQARTVQAVLLAALARLNNGIQPQLIAAGRTDAGVHALEQVIATSLERDIVPERLVLALNALLPDDVRVTQAEVVAAGFNPRREARSRTYRYRILNRRAPSAVWRKLAYHVPQPLNLAAMQTACGLLVGTHDFGAFGTPPQPGGNTIRTMYTARLAATFEYEVGPFVDIELCATAFLTHMVRRIVGTLLWVGSGKLELDGFAAILPSGDPTQGGPTVPAHGLYLIKVEYPAGGDVNPQGRGRSQAGDDPEDTRRQTGGD